MKNPILMLGAALALQGPPGHAPAGPCAGPPLPPGAVLIAQAQPRSDAQSYIRADDYPASSLRRGEQGRVGFSLQIGRDGRVAACRVTNPSGYDALDSATCRIMTARARFTPGKDSHGNPAPSRLDQWVYWTLTPEQAAAAEPGAGPRGQGVISYSLPDEAVAVHRGPPVVNEPVMAVPQDGPGEAELSVWTQGSNVIPTLGRYESIPACRIAKARLKLRPDQRAYCTVAPVNWPDLGIH